MKSVGNLKPVAYKENEKSFMEYWKNNTDTTMYAGFECMAEQYSFMMGNCTDFTGFPGSGKSELALEIMFFLSEEYGIRHALYVPDMGNYKEIRRKLLQKQTGKSLNQKHANYITETEILNSNQWLDYHFLILQKDDPKKPVSPKGFWDFVAEFKDDSGSGIQTGLIDSWKNLRHEYSGREDQYLDEVLSYRNELAEASGKHFFTIAHSGKTDWVQEQKRRRIPNAYDIKGGGAWFDSGKVILTVDYPDRGTNLTNLYFSKVKPDVIGKSGNVEDKLRFNWQRSRYYERVPQYQYDFYAGEALKKMPTMGKIEPLVTREVKTDDEFEQPPF